MERPPALASRRGAVVSMPAADRDMAGVPEAIVAELDEDEEGVRENRHLPAATLPALGGRLW